MKKTIKIENVGEFQIVVGSGQMTVDPASTGANSLPKIAELEISQTLKKKGEERDGHFAKMKSAEKIACHFLGEGNKAAAKKTNVEQLKKVAEAAGKDSTAFELEITHHCNDITGCESAYHKHNTVYKAQSGAVEVKNQEMKELLPEFDAQQKQVKRDNFVYDMPRKNELIDRGTLVCMQCSDCGALFFLPVGDVFDCSKCGFDMSHVVKHVMVPDGQTVDDLITAWMAKGVNEQIKTDGGVISDYRNKEIWYQDGGNWLKLEPCGIGVDISDNDILYEDLTELQKAEVDAQKETNRINSLSDADKLAEKTMKINEAAKVAVEMKTISEIQGGKDALKKSQEFYKIELAKITGIYG